MTTPIASCDVNSCPHLLKYSTVGQFYLGIVNGTTFLESLYPNFWACGLEEFKAEMPEDIHLVVQGLLSKV